eukprot:scaffold2620_cov143-Skeletonema_menzelii.AAC.16
MVAGERREKGRKGEVQKRYQSKREVKTCRDDLIGSAHHPIHPRRDIILVLQHSNGLLHS